MDQIRPGIQLSDLIHDLDTFTFKALKFYERLGYHEFGRLDVSAGTFAHLPHEEIL